MRPRSHFINIRHRTGRLLIFISALILVAACGTVTRWPATALHCDNDDFCHAVQQSRIACRDAALAALHGKNLEKWHQQCTCVTLCHTYSPSAIAIGHDAIIAITDRDATTRVVACFANTHAVVLSSLPLTDEIAADANCRQMLRDSCAPFFTAIAAAPTGQD
jgi:hypothetical protein